MPFYLDPYLYPPRLMRAEPQGIEPPYLSTFTRRRVAPVSPKEERDGVGIEEGPEAPADGEGRTP